MIFLWHGNKRPRFFATRLWCTTAAATTGLCDACLVLALCLRTIGASSKYVSTYDNRVHAWLLGKRCAYEKM